MNLGAVELVIILFIFHISMLTKARYYQSSLLRAQLVVLPINFFILKLTGQVCLDTSILTLGQFLALSHGSVSFDWRSYYRVVPNKY